MSTDKQGTWARLAAQDGPNPLWFWPLVAYVWAGVAGGWASRSDYLWVSVLIGGALLVPIGALVGRVLVREQGKPTKDGNDNATPEGQDARRWAGITAASYLAALTGWCAYAAATDVLKPPDFAAFGVLAAAMLPVALMYAHVRALLLEHEDKLAPAEAAPLVSPHQQVVEELAPTIATPEAVEFTEILAGAELGTPRVIGWKNTWCGFDATVELDPDRDDTFVTVRGKLGKITGRAARRFRARGVQLPEGAIKLKPGESADVVVFKVRLREVLAADVPIPPDTGVRSVNDGLEPGKWEDGEPIEVDVRDQHGISCGASRSGKSTYQNSMIYQLTGCNDALVWMGGTAKLYDLAGPWLLPLADGRATRPVIDFVAGQDWEEVKRMLRVLWTLTYVRQAAPMGVFQKDRNKVIPMNSQPLIYTVLEESDEILKNPEPIDLPLDQKKSAGQIIQYVGSKGLSSRITLELLLQGSTESEMGPYAGSIKRNFLRRTVFQTELKVHGAWLLPSGSQFDTSQLRHKSMVMRTGPDAPVAEGKAAYLNEDHVIPQVAIDHQDRVTILEDYSQHKLIELLGDDYSGRWSQARTKGWREHFAAVGTFPSLEDATPPAVREAAKAGTTAGTGTPTRDTATATAPRPSGSKGTPGEQHGKPGRWFGAFFVPDPPAKSPRPGDELGDIPAEWRGQLEQILGLDVAEPERPVRHRVPEPLGTIVAGLAGTTDEFVSNAELAKLAGVDDTTDLGKTLTGQGVPARKRGDKRGRLVAELRAAAEAWRRGEPPKAAADE